MTVNPSALSASCLFLALLCVDVAAQRPTLRQQEKRLRQVMKEDPHAPERMARKDTKYSMLLRQIKVDEPGGELFEEKGFLNRTTYKSHRDLPPAYWVYARPYWFLFRDRADQRHPKRQWGPEQMIGKPDTTGHGDRDTAWASKPEDDPKGEWVLLEYSHAVKATAVEIHESFNPGAVSRISLLQHDGEEVQVWKAAKTEKLPPERRILTAPLPLGFHVTRIKIYLETGRVPGWNEIDAVALVDDKGVHHWAAAAEASSTFAPDRGAAAVMAAQPQVVWQGQLQRQLQVQPLHQLVRPQANFGRIVRAESAADSGKAVAGKLAQMEKQLAELEKVVAAQQALIEALRKQVEQPRK
jgi:hypothetical protein